MTKSDQGLIVVLLAVAVIGVLLKGMLFVSDGEQYAQISINGEVVRTVTLKEGYVDEIFIGDESFLPKNKSDIARNAIKGYNEHGYNIVEINHGKVRIKEAECPDQICVKAGTVAKAPQQLVCLPNRLVIKIIANDDSRDVDDIAR